MMTWMLRRPIVAGATLGLCWGIVMRSWMRFISGSPEFSWSGTGFILLAATVVGATLGLARTRRSAGGVGWWRMSILSLMLLGAGGAVMWPSVVFGAVAIGRPRPVWLRSLLGVAAVGAQVPVVQESILGESTRGTVGAVLAVAWYAPMVAIEAWAFSIVFAPAVDGAPLPSKLQRVLIGVPIAAMTVIAAIALGIPGM